MAVLRAFFSFIFCNFSLAYHEPGKARFSTIESTLLHPFSAPRSWQVGFCEVSPGLGPGYATASVNPSNKGAQSLGITLEPWTSGMEMKTLNGVCTEKVREKNEEGLVLDKEKRALIIALNKDSGDSGKTKGCCELCSTFQLECTPGFRCAGNQAVYDLQQLNDATSAPFDGVCTPEFKYGTVARKISEGAFAGAVLGAGAAGFGAVAEPLWRHAGPALEKDPSGTAAFAVPPFVAGGFAAAAVMGAGNAATGATRAVSRAACTRRGTSRGVSQGEPRRVRSFVGFVETMGWSWFRWIFPTTRTGESLRGKGGVRQFAVPEGGI